MKGKIFNAQEVQAIIAGNKTQFREVSKPKPLIRKNDDYLFDDKGKLVFQKECCPYQIGQKIFCKESFNIFAGQVSYKQDLVGAERYFWRPASQMKQEHSRLTLLIKETRVERLADISEEDAIAEGNYLDRCECLPRRKDKSPIDACFSQHFCHTHGEEFKHAWNATHKKPEEKFEANPWVWAIDFEVWK